jgi:hypothetical protein
MFGDAGNDTLEGVTEEDPEAADTLNGGPGQDTCVPSPPTRRFPAEAPPSRDGERRGRGDPGRARWHLGPT